MQPIFMRFRSLLTAAALWTITSPVFAQVNPGAGAKTLSVNTTGRVYEFWTIVTKIMEYLAGAIGAVAVTMFVVGALLVTLSGIKEDWRQKGKDLMIGSVMSLAVVLGSYALLRMVQYFLTT
jgi:hypothetical protein